MSEEAKQQRSRVPSRWQPILPVPEDAPQPRFAHPVRGEPQWIFPYRNQQGELLGYVCRFIRSAGGIENITLTWCVNLDDPERARAWRWKQFEKLRPMYLAGGRPLSDTSIVLIVGDEWNAEQLVTKYDAKGHPREPNDPFVVYDLVSWPGGRAKLGEVDWSPLRGKICWIWLPHSAQRFKVAKDDPQSGQMLPQEKQPWRIAARQLRETLVAYGAVPVALVETESPIDLPDGWDGVRMMDAQWDRQRIYDWIGQHAAPEAEIAEANRLASANPTKASGKVEPWEATLIRKDGSGPLLAELHNVRMILTNHHAWRDVIYLDDFAHSVMKAKAPPFQGGGPGEWGDTDDSMTADWLASRCGILKLKSSLVAEGVQTVAKLSARNPLVDYLKGLKWDKTPRLDSWLKDYLSAGPFHADMTEADAKRLEEYLRIIGRKWLLGAVSRALRPGCKFDYVLILEGQQGLGKSTAFAILGGDWSMDTPFSLGDKEGMETIRGMWIVEIAELDAFNKAESTIAKSFFSRTKDRFRLPYAKRSTTFKRTCVFGATTNEDEYFRDPTGNRRYWPVRCDRRGYDKAKLAEVRDQLLAEAVAAVAAGQQIWPTQAEDQVIHQQQARREIPDPWVGRIAAWLRSPEAAVGVTTRERILAEALKVEAARMDERGMATRVGKAMHKLGYIKVEDRSLPERFRYEKRPSSEEGDGT